MDSYFNEAVQIMNELYGKDVQMSLATCVDNKPSVRVIDLYYMDECFYATSYTLSNKVKQIDENPNVSLCKGLFQCFGKAENGGHPLEKKNVQLREKLKRVFYLFYDKHIDESDPHTCILKIKIERAIVFANNYKYIIDFDQQAATRETFINDMIEC